ncbi:MAG: methyltransferase domain-containing protein [Patescibacteria group bacterium]
MNNKFTIDEVRSFWDNVSSTYEPVNKGLGYIHTHRFEKTLEYGQFKQGQTILNIWSRTGNLLPYLRETPNLTIYNREVSPAMLAIARQKYPGENFELTDLENLRDLKDNTFDRIISLETLEHAPKPAIFLNEIYRVLKPGGLLIMSLPPKGMELGLMIYELFFKNHGEGPHIFYWPSEVKKMLDQSGFQLIAHKPALMLPLGNDKLTRLSEKVLGFIFGKTPLANFGVRHFYICKK